MQGAKSPSSVKKESSNKSDRLLISVKPLHNPSIDSYHGNEILVHKRKILQDGKVVVAAYLTEESEWDEEVDHSESIDRKASLPKIESESSNQFNDTKDFGTGPMDAEIGY